MNKLVILLILLFASIAGNAQNDIKSIQIVDSQGKPVKGIIVAINACGKDFKLKTKEDGTVKFNNANCASINIHIGNKFYEDVDTLINSAGSDAKIALKDKIIGLEDIEVKAFRPMLKGNAEKTIYSIDTRGLLKNAKANDALRFLPGVVAENDTYKILGKTSNARLKIDGVAASAEELKMLKATDIKQVEVYNISSDDTAGSSGEINIIRRRHERPRIYGTAQVWTNLLHPFLGNFDTFMYQNKKWDLGARLNYVTNKQRMENGVERQYPATHRIESLYEDRRFDVTQFSQALKVGYYPNSNASITTKLSHDKYSSDITHDTRGFEGKRTNTSAKEDIEHYLALLNGFLKIGKNNSLLLKGNYHKYRYTTRYITGYDDFYRLSMDEFIAELVSENNKISWLWDDNVRIGLKSVWRRNDSYAAERGIYGIQQLHASLSHNFGKKLSMLLILKGETDNLNHERSYEFLPSVRMNYNMGKAGTLSANYQRNVIRPSIDYMNSDTLRVSEFQIWVGNPNLASQHNDAFELSYRKQVKLAYLTFAANYNRQKGIINPAYLDPHDYNTYTYENIGGMDEASLSANWTQRLCKGRLNLSFTLAGLYTNYDVVPRFADAVLMVPEKGFGLSTNLNFSYLTTKQWQYSLQCSYRPQTYSFNTISYQKPLLMGSITKAFINDKLEVSVNFYNSLLYLNRTHDTSKFREMQQRSWRRMYMNRIDLSLTWNFGKWFRGRKGAEAVDNNDIELRK